jgi:uncharacterized protein
MKLTSLSWWQDQFRPVFTWRFAGRFSLWYLAVCALLYFGQRSLLYMPTHWTPEAFQAEVAQRFKGKATILPTFDAVVLEPAQKRPHSTAILFHGNGGSGLDRGILASDFLKRGYRLVLAEYPGYAARPGPLSEEALVTDGQQLLEAVRVQYPEQPVTVVGESLGTAVAIQVAAAAVQPPKELLLMTPFWSMEEVAARKVWMLPTSLLLKDKYRSFEHIAKFKGPVRILVAKDDELVTARAGIDLYAVAQSRGPAELIEVADAKHNTWWWRTSPEQWSTLLGAPVLSETL